jgi:ABC-type glycerol-3-phosphate transport system substrate-binding protein
MFAAQMVLGLPQSDRFLKAYDHNAFIAELEIQGLSWIKVSFAKTTVSEIKQVIRFQSWSYEVGLDDYYTKLVNGFCTVSLTKFQLAAAVNAEATVDGKIYALPNTFVEYVPDGLVYRKDWRRQFNLPEIKDLTTLEAYLAGEEKLLNVTPIGGKYGVEYSQRFLEG